MLEFQIKFIFYEVSNLINTYKKSALFVTKLLLMYTPM